MKTIILTKGGVTTVDDEDFEYLSRWKWTLIPAHRGTKYCVGRIGTIADGNRRNKIILIHREITRCPDTMQVDHIDHNLLNNQKHNLRVCTGQQNSCNRNNWSQYPFKGIHKATRQISWTARIRVNGKLIGLGSYPTQVKAAQVYDMAAVYLFGEFANINFPEHKEDYLRQTKDLEQQGETNNER